MKRTTFNTWSLLDEEDNERQKKRLKHMRLLFICYANWWNHVSKYHLKSIKHDSQLPGFKRMAELWDGNDNRFFEQFRMRKAIMATLLHLLRSKYGFRPFENISIDESLGMFMLIIGHGMTFPNVTERFQHSGQTVSAHFHEILAAVGRMGVDMIKPEDGSLQRTSSQLIHDRRYYPSFAGCIGAIDGTHINLRLKNNHAPAWYDRHGVPSTTVLAVVDFNLCFTYAKMGSEGSMHDSRVLGRAINDARLPFPIPPEGKYYVADAGFPNMKGFLIPYRKTRYHLPDFRQARVIRNKDENFNYVHSSLRSMVERAFGILKARFKILRCMTNFDMRTQIRIIWATIAIHNMLRRYDVNDIDLLEDIVAEQASKSEDTSTFEVEECEQGVGSVYMDNLRNSIRDGLPMRSL